MYPKSCNFKKIHNFYKNLGTKSNIYIVVTFCTQILIKVCKNSCTKSNDYIVVSFCTHILVNFYNFSQTKNLCMDFVYKKQRLYSCYFLYPKSCDFKKIHNFYKNLGTKSNNNIDVTFCTQKLVKTKKFWVFTSLLVQKVTTI